MENTRPQFKDLFIGISGLIGAGKTTLATALGEVMGLPVYYEPVIDNIYLADFYKDPKKYSFNLQVYLLNNRFRQHQQIIWRGEGGVQDRTIYEDSVFAKMLMESGLMERRDYDTYVGLFNNIKNFMRHNDLIVHLDVSPEQSLQRIKMRARDCETGVSLEYLQNLHAAYEQFLTEISHVIPVIRINWSDFKSAHEVAECIKAEYIKMKNIHYVDFNNNNNNINNNKIKVVRSSNSSNNNSNSNSSGNHDNDNDDGNNNTTTSTVVKQDNNDNNNSSN